MDFRILDTQFKPIDTLDQYESIIWTARFIEAGDFELYTPINERLLNAIKVGYYIFSDVFYNPNTNRATLMIIESIEITSDPESSNKIKVTGRDLKSIFDRRIVWGQKDFKANTNLLTVITTLVNGNIINPSNWSKTYSSGDGGSITISTSGSVRKINNVIYEPISYTFPTIDGDYQYNGEVIYDVLVELCDRFNLGWEVLYDFGTGKFVFKMKAEVDHTYNQTGRNPLIFSPSFENLKNSNYIESSTTEKNAGLITGEGDDDNIMYNVVGNEYSGLARKEMSISASDISRISEEGSYNVVTPRGDENPNLLHWYEYINGTYVLTTDETVDSSKTYYAHITEYSNRTYLSMILEKGKNELAQHIYTQTYEGTAEAARGYQYLVDYDIGDICEIINEWGISSKVLISEVVYSISTSSISIVPTFSAVDNNS